MAIDAQIGPHIHICMAMLGSNRTKFEPVHGKLEWAIQSHPPPSHVSNDTIMAGGDCHTRQYPGRM